MPDMGDLGEAGEGDEDDDDDEMPGLEDEEGEAEGKGKAAEEPKSSAKIEEVS